jgi:membrane-bound inhibitor of C-type lysozyme
MDIELRWPAHGEERTTLPLFPDAQGQPFKDYRFTALIKGVLTAIVGETRAKMLSPHSWRVWIATSLRMCGASDARIQAMGRWLNPDSVKIYARMTKEEYAMWIDKIMSVKRIDSTRTTNMPIMDAADAIATVHNGSKAKGEENQLTHWSQTPQATQVSPSPLKRGDRLSVYWTDMNEWYDGTFQCSQVEAADDGGRQRSSCVVYDAKGDEASLTRRKLTYWHCLDDEQWRPLE